MLKSYLATFHLCASQPVETFSKNQIASSPSINLEKFEENIQKSSSSSSSASLFNPNPKMSSSLDEHSTSYSSFANTLNDASSLQQDNSIGAETSTLVSPKASRLGAMLDEPLDDQNNKLVKSYLQIPSKSSSFLNQQIPKKYLCVNINRLPFNSLSDLNDASKNDHSIACTECCYKENTKKCTSSTSCFTINTNTSNGNEEEKKQKVSSVISIKAKCDAGTHIKSLPQSPTDSERNNHWIPHHQHRHHQHHHHSPDSGNYKI